MIIKLIKILICAAIVWFLYNPSDQSGIYNYICLLIFVILLRLFGVFTPSGDGADFLNNDADFFD